MTIIEQIKTEIEKQIKDPLEYCYGVSSINKLRELLSFLSTLEEPVSEELNSEIESFWKENGPMTHAEYDRLAKCARHFAEWGAEHLKK